MNCQSFENSVTDLERRHPIEATAMEQALSHSASCAECALKLEEQRGLTMGLRGLADELKTIQTPNRIEEQLVSALREQAFRPRRADVTSRRFGVAVAAAAILLVVVGIMVMRLRSATEPSLIVNEKASAPETPREITSNVAPEVVAIPTAVQLPVQEKLPRPGYRGPRRFVAKHRGKADRDSSLSAANTAATNANAVAIEVATEFMPLGDVGMVNLQEGAQVVRVEMPRYAMARFGLPVNMERYDERVKADVWVGVDGLPRAIRFVQ